ncbi:hypothetical protein [Spirosoma agri]|nr:hypothetical protein [Spirosoma agri]
MDIGRQLFALGVDWQTDEILILSSVSNSQRQTANAQWTSS